MQIRLPDWPRDRLIAEACQSVNLRRPGAERLDPTTSPWSGIYSAVLAFCRHNLTDYDQRLSAFERDLVPQGGPELALRHSAERERLREMIHAAARTQYRWLRPDVDPRMCAAAEDEPEQRVPYFTRLSKLLSDLYTTKNRALIAAEGGILRNGRERLLRTSYFRRKRRFKEKTKLREAEDRYRLGKSQ